MVWMIFGSKLLSQCQLSTLFLKYLHHRQAVVVWSTPMKQSILLQTQSLFQCDW